MGVLAIIGLFFLIAQIAKETSEPEVPASYWNNQKKMDDDLLNPNISFDDVMNNIRMGVYQ